MYLLGAIFLSKQVSFIVQDSIILTICDMNFFQLFLSQGFFPNITLPTRVTNTTATLIDQIYSKTYDTSQNSYSGILVSKIWIIFQFIFFKSANQISKNNLKEF